jgi:hypothetical protein
MSTNSKLIGEKVSIRDCSWSYALIDGNRVEHRTLSFGLDNWIVLDTDLPLPTPPGRHAPNDTILYKNGRVVYIQSRFIYQSPCPSCGRY